MRFLCALWRTFWVRLGSDRCRLWGDMENAPRLTLQSSFGETKGPLEYDDLFDGGYGVNEKGGRKACSLGVASARRGVEWEMIGNGERRFWRKLGLKSKVGL